MWDLELTISFHINSALIILGQDHSFFIIVLHCYSAAEMMDLVRSSDDDTVDSD